MTYELHHGNCIDVLATMDDASIDSIVTDPPYEISFMGRSWDGSGIAYSTELWRQCLRVLKPGGHLLAFGGTRTYHRMAVAIEDAGFEIRDSIHWLYGSGFPKSLNVSKSIDKIAGATREVVGTKRLGGNAAQSTKEKGGTYATNTNSVGVAAIEVPITAPATAEAIKWDGWGTALKPAHEPIVVARKPLAGTVTANVLTHGTGAINIDGTRVGVADNSDATGRWPANLLLTHTAECVLVGATSDTYGGGAKASSGFVDGYANDGFKASTTEVEVWECAKGCPVAALDDQSGIRPGGVYPAKRGQAVATSFASGQETEGGPRTMGDSGGASRYFTCTGWDPIADTVPFRYVAKANKKERNAEGAIDNRHPTVKPIALMRWLVRLVTPPSGTVLDPFAGSGTTLAAATLEGFDSVGIELTEEYLPIIHARTEWAMAQTGLPFDQPTTHHSMSPNDTKGL